MHPIDIAPRYEEDHSTPPSGQGSGLWALIALLIIVAIVVAATFAFSAGDDRVEQPTPTVAPGNPGY